MKVIMIIVSIFALWAVFLTFASIGMEVFSKDAIKSGVFTTSDGKAYRVTLINWSDYDNTYKRAD